MHYLEKQIDGGDWFVIAKAENKSDLVNKINILREKEFCAFEQGE